MAGFDLKVLHNDFPDLPLKAVEFFHPDNAPVEANNMKPRSVFEFAKHVEIKDPESPSSGFMPKWQLLNKICKILVEYDVLMDLGGGGPLRLEGDLSDKHK